MAISFGQACALAFVMCMLFWFYDNSDDEDDKKDKKKDKKK